MRTCADKAPAQLRAANLPRQPLICMRHATLRQRGHLCCQVLQSSPPIHADIHLDLLMRHQQIAEAAMMHNLYPPQSRLTASPSLTCLLSGEEPCSHWHRCLGSTCLHITPAVISLELQKVIEDCMCKIKTSRSLCNIHRVCSDNFPTIVHYCRAADLSKYLESYL